MPAAIQFCRLIQFLRNILLEECPCYNHVINTQRSRDDQRPHGVQKSCFLYHQVHGDHSAAEEHCDHVKDRHRFLQEKFLSGERICRRKRYRQIEHCSAKGIEKRIQKASYNPAVLENLRVSFKVQTDGIKDHLTSRHRFRIGNGRNNDKI